MHVRRGSHPLHHVTVLLGLDARPAAEALLGFTKDVAGTTLLQIAAGNIEARSKSSLALHDTQPLRRLLTDTLGVHQVSMCLHRSAPNAAAQLMKLSEAKPVLWQAHQANNVRVSTPEVAGTGSRARCVNSHTHL